MDLLNFLLILTGSTALVLIVKRLFDMQITPRGHMVLWLVIAVQLLAWPLADRLPEADWSLKGWMPQVYEETEVVYVPRGREMIGQEGQSSQNIQPQESMQSGGEADLQSEGNRESADGLLTRQQLSFHVPGTGAPVSLKPGYVVTDRDQVVGRVLVNWIWPLSSLLAALVVAAGGIGQRRKLAGLPRCNPAAQSGKALLDCFLEVKKLAGVKARVDLRTGADSTMLAGLLRPTVYLAKDLTPGLEGQANRCGLEPGGGVNRCGLEPEGTTGAGEGGGAAALDLTALRHVFAHELIHYRHRDLWLNVAAAAVICIFWWNPVMWLAFRRFRRDMEVYCDYDAVRLLDDKKGYARTLVRAAAGSSRFVVGTTSLIGGEKEVSRRVKALAAFKKPKTWVCVLAAGILLGVCVGLMVNPASAGKLTVDESQVESKLNRYSNGVVKAEMEWVEPETLSAKLGTAPYGLQGEITGLDGRQMQVLEVTACDADGTELGWNTILPQEQIGTETIPFTVEMEAVPADLRYFLRVRYALDGLEDTFTMKCKVCRDPRSPVYESPAPYSEDRRVCPDSYTPEEAVEAYIENFAERERMGMEFGGAGKVTALKITRYALHHVKEDLTALDGGYSYAFQVERPENFSPAGSLGYGEGEYADWFAGPGAFILAKHEGYWYVTEEGVSSWLWQDEGLRCYFDPLSGLESLGVKDVKYLDPALKADAAAFTSQIMDMGFAFSQPDDGLGLRFTAADGPDGTETYSGVWTKEWYLYDNLYTMEGSDGIGDAASALALTGKGITKEVRVYNEDGDTGYRIYRFTLDDGAGFEFWVGKFEKTDGDKMRCRYILNCGAYDVTAEGLAERAR